MTLLCFVMQKNCMCKSLTTVLIKMNNLKGYFLRYRRHSGSAGKNPPEIRISNITSSILLLAPFTDVKF